MLRSRPRAVHRPLLGAALLAAAAGFGTAGAAPAADVPAESRVPVEPFEAEPIRITVEDLPEPFASESVSNNPKVVVPPDDFHLHVPEGFQANLFAEGIEKARWLALTPEGDVLVSCGRTNKIHLLRDTNDDGVSDERSLFLDESNGANLPFGMDFAQVDGQWHFYLGNTDAVLRYPYEKGQTKITAVPVPITELPGQGYNQHWTRNVRVAPDGKHLFATVGSESNVDKEAPPRAAVLRMNLDGTHRSVYASGLRNPVGLDFHPETGAVYVNVNERDKIGDDLVPDYLTLVKEGAFYGWPYAYLTPENVDPRRTENGQSERPDLVAQTVTPDVLYRSHSAALGLAFCDSDKWPERYRGGAFSAFRGSWNRDEGTGYKIVFVPFENGRPTGVYEDFVTGFLLDPSVPLTCGRPVSVHFAADGALLFTEEGNGRVYRITPPSM
ncbi:PQQ-dependent sugar dehydrogenase [Alienimonas sp. DA493]|uniref:PQQ-dependent sugar dehydrogenase n=1 Tax=Alienimonas sp. DA493 TaxID=3373605 RepID=UPI003754B60A